MAKRVVIVGQTIETIGKVRYKSLNVDKSLRYYFYLLVGYF